MKVKLRDATRMRHSAVDFLKKNAANSKAAQRMMQQPRLRQHHHLLLHLLLHLPLLRHLPLRTLIAQCADHRTAQPSSHSGHSTPDRQSGKLALTGRNMRYNRPKSDIYTLDGSYDVWGLRFPDIDGCVGGGKTPETAIADATEALRDVLAHKQANGIAFPKASSIADILKQEKPGKTESTVIMPVTLNAGRSVCANLTLDAGLLEAIDTAAGRAGVTRSALIASATREKFEA
jgi:predicted RNase H-like HicB family nuclease